MLEQLLGNPAAADLSVREVLINLALSALLAWLAGVHFVRFGSTFSNRRKFAGVLPAIALTTTLVISIVKASLALSLGLVGALSIVRFRTPVKEPEELAYLFIAIAVGLGTGADQRLVTLAAVAAILAVLTVRAFVQGGGGHPNMYVNVELEQGGAEAGTLRALSEAIGENVRSADMRRYDVHQGQVQATFFIDCPNADALVGVQEAIQSRYPGASVTFVEQSGLPGN